MARRAAGVGVSGDGDPIAGCAFCSVAAGEAPAHVVFSDEAAVAFLDRRPLFPGHTLVVPRRHFPTLADLPADLVGPYFSDVRLVTAAVEEAMSAEGSFVAMNNRVSQSVPHLHAHVVPRSKGDGLRGFFWPRQKVTEDELAETAERLRETILRLR